MSSVANTETKMAHHTSVHATGLCHWPSLAPMVPNEGPFHSARSAVTRCDSGLAFANDANQLGIDSVGTKAFDANVSGNSVMNTMPWTARCERASRPTSIGPQARH